MYTYWYQFYSIPDDDFIIIQVKCYYLLLTGNFNKVMVLH